MLVALVLLKFELPGMPQGQQRARVGRGHHYTPGETEAYRDRVMIAAVRAAVASSWPRPITNQTVVEVVVRVYVPRPLNRRRRKDPRGAVLTRGKPDVDNVGKLIMDALKRCRCLDDDTAVGRLIAERWWLPITAEGADLAPPVVRVQCRDVVEVDYEF